MTPPLLSLCIPLYRAAPFHDSIVRAIETIDYPNVEFLIAEHHRLDDTAERLNHRFESDPRVSVFSTTDELTWIENFNFLASRARGDYFRWLAQDDTEFSNIEAAIEHLETHPDCLIAYGGIELVLSR